MSMLFLEGGPRPLNLDAIIEKNLPEYEVEKVYVPDFDDTLSITQMGVNGLLAVCEQQGLSDKISEEVILKKRREAWAMGHSYNVLELLEEEAQETMEDIRSRFRTGEGGHLMGYEDAMEFSDRLAAYPATPSFILSYGENVDRYPDGGLQADKIQRSRSQGWLSIGFAYLLAHTDKGPAIDSLRHRRGSGISLFGYDNEGKAVGLYHAKQAVLIDDRKASLTNVAQADEPVLIRRPWETESEKQRRGELPEHAKDPIKSLTEITINKDMQPANEAAVRRGDNYPEVAAFVPVKLLSNMVMRSLHMRDHLGEVA